MSPSQDRSIRDSIHATLSPRTVLSCDPSTGARPITEFTLLRALGVVALFVTLQCHADDLDGDLAAGPQAAPDALPSTQETCTATDNESPLRNELGSAGIMYNMAEHPKSLRVVAAKLLTDALDSPTVDQAVDCAKECTAAKDPEIIYRVGPTVFLPQAQQQALCLTLERDTKLHPLVFPAREFDTVEELNSWVMEFSQGRGDDGKRLYQQCGANCSPRYTFLIASGTAGLRVNPQVICGLARDRDRDDYRVSTAIRRPCVLAPAKLATSTTGK